MVRMVCRLSIPSSGTYIQYKYLHINANAPHSCTLGKARQFACCVYMIVGSECLLCVWSFFAFSGGILWF